MSPIDHLTDDELLRELREASRELPDAPPALQRAAIGLWAAAAASRVPNAGAGELLKRVLARLSFDSWAAPSLAHGMRSLRAPTRHLLFTEGARDVDLRISPVGDTYSITGQVLGADTAGAIELAVEGVHGTPTHHTTLDALGEFRLAGLHAGTYVMTLRQGDDELTLPAFDVGESHR